MTNITNLTNLTNILIPHVGETTTSVRIGRWLKAEGEPVRKGEPVLEVDTDKSTLEIEALADGVLERIVAPEGAEADAMQVVGVIRSGEAQPAAVPIPAPVQQPANASPLAQKMAHALGIGLEGVARSGPGGRITQDDVRRLADATAPPINTPTNTRITRIQASPKAKRLAAELGVDLALLKGSGADGLVQASDVQAAAQGRGAPATPAMLPLSRTRQAIAARMQDSKRNVPHFYLVAEVEMTQAQRLRQYCKDVLGWAHKPTLNDLIVRAAALALRAMPQVNVGFAGEGYVQHDEVNLGIAVGRDEGLLVPVLKHADGLTLAQVAEQSRERVARARLGKLRESDVGVKSMVVSNLGMYGMDAFFAIIDPPDPMILAVGRVADRVVPVNGRVGIRPYATLTLSADHRLLDGMQAAQFLERVRALLEGAFELLR